MTSDDRPGDGAQSKTSSRNFELEREIAIDAPAERIHALIDDLHEWPAWSPWEETDPDMKRTYTGAQSGAGASYSWQGNRKAGSGNMTIRETVPGRKVVIDLNFRKPFKAENLVTFLIDPQPAATLVRWQMTGERNLFMRLFGVSMDKLVGKDFERGLAKLKAAAESEQD